MNQDDGQPPPTSIAAAARSREQARRALLGGRTAILLDVEADHLDDVLEEVARAIAGDQNQSSEYLDAVRESLSRHADSGPDVLDGGVAIIHDRVREAEGPVVDVLVRTAKPLALRDEDGEPVRFLWVLISGEATHPHIGAAAEFAHLMHHAEFADAAHVAETPDELVAAFEHALRLDIGFGRIPPELERTGKLFGGIVRDFRRRLPWWLDDFRAGLRIKVLASVLFMFVACLAAAWRSVAYSPR
jgi:mannitol/fructose-specific phosphotransferase system IIA component (Ntr-type)